ncbi:MAG: c-type cytochrome domain-containing protein [Planctomycetaceae bacterium]
MIRSPLAVLSTGLLTVLLAVASSKQGFGQAPIEPLLQKYCLGCHNETDKEGGLSLQTPESLKKGGENGPVLDQTDVSKSLLISVLAKGTDKSMPPDGEAQPSDAEREMLKQWVLAGANIKSMAAGTPEVPNVKPFHTVTPPLLASAMLANGERVVVGGSRHVALRDIASGRELWKTEIADGKVSGLSVGHTQPWVIAAVGTPGVAGTALLLSADDGRVLNTFVGHTDSVYAAILNGSDTLLATAGYDRRILIHDVATKDVLHTLEGHNGSVFALSFDPAGRVLCSASADGTVKVWNVKTGQRLDTLSQPQAEQYSVLVSKSGDRIFAAGADNRIRIWQLLSTDSPRINPPLVSQFAHEQSISRLALSPDGTLLASCAEDGTLRTWTTTPFAAVQTLTQQTATVTSLTFLDNQRLFVTRLDGTSDVLPLAASKPASESLTEHTASPMLARPLPDTLTEVPEGNGDNNAAASSQAVTLPAKIVGTIQPNGGDDTDTDCFRFPALAGQTLLLEVNAAQNKSPLDSRIEVLTANGDRIVQTKLQAVRDSWFTFRGKDSDTADDFRVFNWEEMELNEYLYADGEVVKLWLYPRGPDSGFQVYPGFGNRFTYFGTTPTAHALQAPCFIVVPQQPDEELTPNGLPVFPVYYENDDDGRRELGRDSRLFFTAPSTGDYVVQISDARGFSGEDYKYELTIRAPRPGFDVAVSTKKLTVSPGTGQEIGFTAKRIDGYEGPITIDVTGLPPGFQFSGPVQIQSEQLRAFGTLYAMESAVQPTAEQLAGLTFVATTSADSTLGEHRMELGGLDELTLGGQAKLRATIVASVDAAPEKSQPVILQIRPGQTIQAAVTLDRISHQGVVSFGTADSGRNLPHGVYVDNIGLNGLLLLEDQSQREFFITAARWVPPSTSTFFLKTNVDSVTTFPVTLEVLPAENEPPGTTVTAAQQ